MMSFEDIEIKTEYRSGKSDVIKDFYIPVLSRAVKYQRAVPLKERDLLSILPKKACGLTKIPSRNGWRGLILS